MKKLTISYFIGFWLIAASALAQTPKPDQIVKLDNTIIEALIDEVSETEIFYRLPANPKGTMQKIAKSEVWKIIYASGSTDEINKPQPKEKSDKIIRKDGSIIEGKIVTVSVGKVEYKSLTEGDDALYMVSGADVAKVAYADGTVKDLSAKSKKEKTPKVAENKEKASKTGKKKKDTFDNQILNVMPIAKPSILLDVPRLVIGIAAEGTYVLEPLSKMWVATSDSAGLQQGLGISFRSDLHLTRGLAFSATVGYNQWQVQRNYVLKDLKTQTTTVQYSSLDKFAIIPIQVGIKLYIAKGFYLMPEASFNIIASNFQNKDGNVSNPGGNLSISSSLGKIGYGGSLGFEVYKLPFVIDVSARFQTIKADQFRNIGEPLYYAGLRLGVGFAVGR